MCLSSLATAQAKIPTPQEVLGFTPGEDRKLASWSQMIDYFERLDRASDRLVFETLGNTSMGKPFVMATISSPANLARLEEFRQIQDQLADPRKLGPLATRDRKAAELIRRGKTIVLITCGIHSTEVGSYLSSTLIAHRLASSTEPEIQKILDNTIILLVPSLNPDGVDIVKNWYDKTLGTPFEGTDPPELYHKYTGHDNNRDWYAFTQVETQTHGRQDSQRLASADRSRHTSARRFWFTAVSAALHAAGRAKRSQTDRCRLIQNSETG